MLPPFEEALDALLDQYVGSATRDEIISAFELKLMALHEEAQADDEDKDEAVS